MKRIRLMLLACLFAFSSVARTDTVPVTSAEFAIETITRFELRRLYFMKDRWLEGAGLVILYQRPAHSDAHLRFIRETLGVTPASYFKELSLAVNTGKGVVISTVNTDEDMIEKVSARDNAIGYLDVDTIIIRLDKSTKFLKVTDE